MFNTAQCSHKKKESPCSVISDKNSSLENFDGHMKANFLYCVSSLLIKFWSTIFKIPIQLVLKIIFFKQRTLFF